MSGIKLLIGSAICFMSTIVFYFRAPTGLRQKGVSSFSSHKKARELFLTILINNVNVSHQTTAIPRKLYNETETSR